MLQYTATIATAHRGPRPMPRDKNWLSVSQAADLLGISRFTPWRMHESNRLPAWVRTFKPASQMFYWREDIERLRREAESHPEE